MVFGLDNENIGNRNMIPKGLEWRRNRIGLLFGCIMELHKEIYLNVLLVDEQKRNI